MRSLGTAFVLKLIGGVIAFLAAIAMIFVLRPDDGLSHWLVAIIAAGAVFQAFNAIEFWFNAQVQAKYAVLAKNAAFLICAARQDPAHPGRSPAGRFCLGRHP